MRPGANGLPSQSTQTLALLCTALLVLVWNTSPRANAQSREFVSVNGSELRDPNGNVLFLRGINLGNWLVPEGYMFKFKHATSPRLIHEVISELLGPEGARDFWKEFQDRYVTREDIAFIKNVGLNSVRIPFHYRLFTSEGYLGTWPGRGFELLDRVVNWCREEGLWVILDMHCAPGGQTGDNIDDSWGYPWLFESPDTRQQVVEVWRSIARRYRNEAIILGYDLLNEPVATYFDFETLNPLLEPLYREIVGGIREVDSTHLILLGGAQWNTNFEVFGPPFDSLLVYTFHKYWCDTTEAEIQAYIDFRGRYNVPVWMGESGENTDRWISGFRRLLERNRIGWCFWPYKKMDAASCMVTFNRPTAYDIIAEYADANRESFKQIRTLRPPAEKTSRSLSEFLDNCLFDKCRVNAGYLEALGLKADASRGEGSSRE